MPSLFRQLTHEALQAVSFRGEVLDLGGSKTSEYMQMVKKTAKSITVLNMDPGAHPDIFADLEQVLPCAHQSFDMVLMMNVLEHIYHYRQLLDESWRVLRSGGECLIIVPFLFQVHPSPNDYFRYTKQSLMRLLEEAGFQEVQIQEIGTGPMGVRYQMLYNFFPEILRRFMQPSAMFWDKCLRWVMRLLKKADPRVSYPLGYFVQAKKP